MNIQFRCSYQHEHDFDVWGGTDEDKRISVLLGPRDFRKPDGSLNGWNYTEDEFQRQVNCSVGILHYYGGKAVSRELLLKFKEETTYEKNPEYNDAGFITTGYYDHGTHGWVRLFQIEPADPERDHIQDLNLRLMVARVPKRERKAILAHVTHISTKYEDVYPLSESQRETLMSVINPGELLWYEARVGKGLAA